MENKFYDSILSSRIKIGKPFAEESTHRFYNDLVERYEIKDLPLVLCNTLQRRTCLSYVNDKPYLIFDTAVIDLFHLFYNAAVLGKSEEFIRLIFLLTSSEQYFADGQYALALQFSAKYLNELEKTLCVLNVDIEKDAPAPLFIQQAFLLTHELIHYLLSIDLNKYVRVIEAKQGLLKHIFSYAQQKSDVKLGESFIEAINNKTLIEECACDSIGAISAIDIGIKLKKHSESGAALSIINALNYQFILSCIENFNDQINRKINFDDLNQFNFRLLHLKAFMSRYLHDEFGPGSAHKFDSAVQKSDYFINNSIQIIAKLYRDESLSLQEHFDRGDSISLEVRKQLLQIYSL